MHSDHFDLHAALVPYLSDREWANRLSIGFGKYRDRSDALAERDPDSLSPLEAQFLLSTRVGCHGESSMRAREAGALLASVKKHVGQGFESWVRAFCLFSLRSAFRYLHAARESTESSAKMGEDEN
jgi:hypothetical protein